VLFAAVNSEERGLLGAWAYTLDPVAPLDRTVAAINMDMIGRNEEVPEPGGGRFNGLEPQTAESNRNALNVIGSVRAPDLRAAIDGANQAFGLDIRYRYDNNASQLMRRSDHWPFIQNGVPAVWMFTGLHPDYHRGTDTADRINYEKMARILRLVYQVTWDLAEADGRPALLPRGGLSPIAERD
jgi:Zn-dependent M28 family amino/carboxypeptidase